jgi:membrane protein YqaA with SNARE-associated domain
VHPAVHAPQVGPRVTGFFYSIFGFFLTWWGAFLMAALDTSMLFFLPFGVDAVVIFLAARNEELFWLYPLLATAGSLTGAAVTFWIGRKIGDAGLERLLPGKRLERLKCKVNEKGAVAMAIPALLPPPFPLTPFILTCGALDVHRVRFFATFGVVRLLRFGLEAILARIYGRRVLAVLQSDAFQTVVIGFVVIALTGTIVSAVMLWRSTHQKRAVAA